MATIYGNFLSGTTSDNPLLIGATTFNSAGLAAMPTVGTPDTMWVVLDPEGVNGAPEIVKVTVHTGSATSATVTRGQQGTAAREHPSGTVWCVSVTKSDLDELPFRKVSNAGEIPVATAAKTVGVISAGTATQVLHGGSTPSWSSVNLADLAGAVQNLLVPAGTISATISPSAPTGWLFHNQTVIGAESSYPALWAVAPAGWKSGSNLVIPNMADRFMIQAGTTALGSTGGANSITLTSANLPTHTHTMNHDHPAGTTSSESATHTHTINHDHPSVTTSSGGSHSHGVSGGGAFLANNGGGVTLGSPGPAYSSGEVAATTTASAHTHTADVPAYTGSSGTQSANHTHSFDVASYTGDTGNGGFANSAINSTPQHIAVNVMIKAH
jgi:microcystin-dependent protein